MLRTRLHITPYERKHRDELLNLSYYSRWTHQHLDWYKMRQWIDDEAALLFLAWQGRHLVGYMGLSAALNASSWIRLLGIGDGVIPAPVIQELWQSAAAQCLQLGISSVMILLANNWLSAYVRQLGFAWLEDIITLNHIGGKPPAPPLAPVEVVPARAEDLPRIAQIDHLAFYPPWQMSPRDLWRAFRISASATIAILADNIVGYQISTRHQEAGHLARLAVTPAHQGKQIGSALLAELLREFNHRGIHSVTVNTQLSNRSSQHLYQHYGFFRNGFDLEVWHKSLP